MINICPVCGAPMKILWRFDDFFCPNSCDKKQALGTRAWIAVAATGATTGSSLTQCTAIQADKCTIEELKPFVNNGYSLYEVSEVKLLFKGPEMRVGQKSIQLHYINGTVVKELWRRA